MTLYHQRETERGGRGRDNKHEGKKKEWRDSTRHERDGIFSGSTPYEGSVFVSGLTMLPSFIKSSYVYFWIILS